MRRAYQIIIALGLCLFLFLLYFHTIPSFIYFVGIDLTFFSLVLALFITGRVGFTRWRKSSRFWMFPVLLCLAFMSSPFWNDPIGNFLADQYFVRHLNEYTQVVNDVRNGVIPCGETFSRIDVKKPPPHIKYIFAVRCNDGKTILVDFLDDFSCVFFHEGYVYKGYIETDGCIPENIRRHNLRHIVGNWYHFYD
jgi:hypothetical protein